MIKGIEREKWIEGENRADNAIPLIKPVSNTLKNGNKTGTIRDMMESIKIHPVKGTKMILLSSPAG